MQHFQTTAFNSKNWKIFLIKFVQENGFKIIKKHNRPDFNIEKDGIELFTTIKKNRGAQTKKGQYGAYITWSDTIIKDIQ